MVYKLRRITHAIWIYLNQSITPNPEEKSVWKIKEFTYLYQIKLLESCWSQNSIKPDHDFRGQDEYKKEN